MAAPLISREFFEGVAADKQLRFDPALHTLPALQIGKVYALDATGDVVLAGPASDIVLGIYAGSNNDGFPQFEQLFYTDPAAFGTRGTRWYLSGAGDLTSTPNDAPFGIAVDEDTLLITFSGRTGSTGGGEANTASNEGSGVGLALAKVGVNLPFRTLTSPDSSVGITVNGNEVELTSSGIAGVDAAMNGAVQTADADTFDFVSDEAGGRHFAEVVDNTPVATIEVDLQTSYSCLGNETDEPTGFVFDADVYRACELIYVLEKHSGEFEAGTIVMVHDDTDAGVVVVRRGSELAPFTQGNPNVLFSADVDGGQCRLLYTETDGDDFEISIKARPIRKNVLPPDEVEILEI